MSEAAPPEASWHGLNFLDPGQRDAFRHDPHAPLARLRNHTAVIKKK